ncbi:MAG: hypothetical protein R3F65_25955 [bacterium]
MRRRLASLLLTASMLAACRPEPPPRPPPRPLRGPRPPPPPRPRLSAAPRRRPPRSLPAPAAAAPAAPPSAAAASPSAADRAAMRAAEESCADCHPEVVDAWRRSPMGRSLGRLDPTLAATLGDGAVTHPATGERFTVAGGRVFAELPAADAPGARFEATHVIGSGAHTRSFARLDGTLSLMPLTWYRSRGGWDLSPGYDIADHPAFYRRARLECLACHADPPAMAAGTDDRLLGEPVAIGCARCHGDPRPHVAARLAGQPSPPVVPTRLDPGLGADVCGQCHLQGAVRLLRAGRRWDDTAPGRPLGEVVAVFARETPGQAFGIASHAERLGRSACAQASPTARVCTTCHAPHPTGAVPDRSAGCRGCHGGDAAHRCTGPSGDDCAGCHMVTRPTSDIPHVAMTDHFIRVRPASEARPAEDDGPLVWINRPAGVDEAEARLLLGRAYAESARARISNADREQATALLTAALADRPDDAAGWADLAAMKRLAGDLPGARRALEEAVRRDGRAEWIAHLTGLRLATGDLDGARALLDRLRALRPGDPDDALLAARVALAAGQPIDAPLAAFEAARPDQGDAAALRAVVARADGDAARAHVLLEAAVAREPGDVAAWLELCRLRADRARWDAAADACERGAALARGFGAVTRFAGARARVKLGRGDAQAAAELAAVAMEAAPADAAFVLGRLALAAGRPADALALLDRAIELDPMLGEAWQALAEVLRARGEAPLAERAAAQAARLGVTNATESPTPAPRRAGSGERP